MENIHTTSKKIKSSWAQKLLSGAELTMEDRESIAYELGCESLLEITFRRLCQKLWIQSKPSTLKLTSDERHFLSKIFPKNKKGRKATGAGDSAIMAAMLYKVVLENNSYDAAATYEDLGKTLHEMYGSSNLMDAVRKSVKRGKDALADQEDEKILGISESMQKKLDSFLIKAAMEEYFIPTHIDE